MKSKLALPHSPHPQPLCARLKKGYGYYYYLCFKDFIKKLLKPKKMIAVKWRIDPNGDFKFYTEITNDLFYYCSPIFYQGEFNQENKTYDFEIENFDEQLRVDVIDFRPLEFFRIITNNNNFILAPIKTEQKNC